LCRKFAQQFANELRRRRPRPGDKRHLDEVFLKSNSRYAPRCSSARWRNATPTDAEIDPVRTNSARRGS
jgi:hypothetical protein